MASSDVFQDLHAKEIRIENNTSDITVANLQIRNVGTGDANIRLSGGAATFTFGIDNSDSDIFKMTYDDLLGSTFGFSMDTSNRAAVGGAAVSTGILSLISTSLAFYPPRMSSVQMEAINAVSGAMIFNTTSGAHYVVSGANGVWVRMYS